MTPPLMLFAAGFGRRMGALTADRPKPLIPVAGRPLIDHALAVADGAGIARRVANVHHRPEALAAHLEARGVAVSREDPILETGGGLRAALPLLGPGPVLTLNTDAVWSGPNPLRALVDAWAEEPEGTEALLLCVPLERAAGRAPPGDFTLGPDGRLGWGGSAVYVGAQMIDPRALADVPDTVFSLTRVWDAMMGRGALRGVLWPGAWCDVGHPGGIAEAESMLAQAVP
jgi:MurNAc alpha-1-phosphate uridylyltransferase